MDADPVPTGRRSSGPVGLVASVVAGRRRRQPHPQPRRSAGAACAHDVGDGGRALREDW